MTAFTTTPTLANLPASDSRSRVSEFMKSLQDEICQGLEEVDGQAKFIEDSWQRPEGGGGRSRVLREGAIFEQAGVNFSEVWGKELPPSIAKQRPEAAGHQFYATGTSMVLHPHNPYIPTVHLNYRYFEAGPVWWFGGGADLTPYYAFEEDASHFHRTFKQVCDQHHPEYYPVFKRWCDEYFYLNHRQEARGIGGIFFDYQDGLDPLYRGPFAESDVQLYRRGRYVEFNLVYDRGTIFGLQTNGRTESILMSLPPLVRWEYCYQPAPNTPEAKLYDIFLKPQDWVNWQG